jgi:hypothetical protein
MLHAIPQARGRPVRQCQVRRCHAGDVGMKRVVFSIVALLATTAASPPTATYIIATIPNAFALGGGTVRPKVQTGPVLGFTAAPMPNSDTSAPTAQAANQGQPTVAPSLFTTRPTYRGEGYVAGSSAQADQQKNYRPVPGINLSVPLH